MKLTTKYNQEAGQKMVAIFSSERYDKTAIENQVNYDQVFDHLKQHNITFSVGQGCYKGDKEPSFICLPKNDQDVKVIKALASLYNQESVLFRNKHCVFLYFPESNHTEKIGDKLVNVTEQEAMKHDCYTILLDKHYIVK